MKIYLCLMVGLFFIHPVWADEIAKKTDGNFVGTSFKGTKSSFLGSGDNAPRKVDYSFAGREVDQKTDGSFVGDKTLDHDHVYFKGESYKEQVKKGVVPAFAQEHSEKDVVRDSFEGDDVDQKTDGSFVGSQSTRTKSGIF